MFSASGEDACVESLILVLCSNVSGWYSDCRCSASVCCQKKQMTLCNSLCQELLQIGQWKKGDTLNLQRSWISIDQSYFLFIFYSIQRLCLVIHILCKTKYWFNLIKLAVWFYSTPQLLNVANDPITSLRSAMMSFYGAVDLLLMTFQLPTHRLTGERLILMTSCWLGDGFMELCDMKWYEGITSDLIRNVTMNSIQLKEKKCVKDNYDF